MSSGWADTARIATTSTRPQHTRHDLAQVMVDDVIWAQGYGAADPLELPPVYAAVRLLTTHIDQLPLHAHRGPVDVELPLWLRRPRTYGAHLDTNELLHYLTASLAIMGRAFLQVTKVGDAGAWRLDPVHPAGVTYQRTTPSVLAGEWRLDGRPIERVPAEPSQWERGRKYLLPMAYTITPDRPDGVGPLQAMQRSMSGYLATERYALALFDNGTVSGGMLETDQDISPAVAKAWQERWVANRKTGAIPVLGNGLRYRNEVMSARDAMWIEARAFNLAEVCRAYGIPPAILGSSFTGGQSLSYQNAQDNYRLLRTSALESFTQTISNALSTLLPPGRSADEDVRVAFDYETWLGAVGALTEEEEPGADDTVAAAAAAD